MKIEELRIGNWIEFDAYGSQFIQVSKESFNEIEEHHYSYIPINEEWLIKFGFIKSTYYNSEFAEYRTSYEKDLFVLKENFEYFNYTNLKCKLEYVHQLQNIFYCLLGKELKIIL